MRLVVSGLMALLVSCVAMGRGECLETHGRDLLRRFCKTDEWFGRQSEEGLRYLAFFHDLDGDGHLDAVLADADNYDVRSSLWAGVRFRTEGDLEISDKKGPDKSVNVNAREDQFFVLQSKRGEFSLTVVNALVYDVKPVGQKAENLISCDVRLKMTPDGCLLYDRLPNGPGYELFSGAAERLERAYSCFYYGSELKPRSMAPDCAFRPLRKGAAFEDGMYRLLTEILSPTPSETNSVEDCCHVVYLDADNDGDTDCYVARGRGADELDWKLYLNEQGDFRRAEKTIWQNKARRYGFTAVEPEVRAATNAFYRVVATEGEPSVIVVRKDGEGYYSQSERKFRGEFSPGEIFGLEETIRHPCFHAIERLPSKAYRAPSWR